ncbi:MAG: NAD(P)(+) transhydrogenase (Re/Si-specific) subunit alpha, partial [Bacteroidota bacterium]
MIIGILKEKPPERRVSMLPEIVAMLNKMNVTMMVETGAGLTAFASNDEYELAGAQLVSKEEVLEKAGLIIKINPPVQAELDQFKEGQIFLAAFHPLLHKKLVRRLAEKKVISFSMDVIPHTIRAQTMDISFSMDIISGYKAVLKAAILLPRFFPMFMTTAGTIIPAKVLVLGAGVAGLQAV